MARPLRVQFEGALYHLIIQAIHRQMLFRDHKDKARYLELLSRYRGQFEFKLYAFVLMTHHLHLLIETPKGNVGKVMQCLGTSYTQYFNRRHKRRGALFEGRYKSYLVDKENHLLEVSRNIHRRHFQKGFRHRKVYLWSSYPVYLGRRVSGLVDVEPILGQMSGRGGEQRRHYEGFVEAAGNGRPCEVRSRQFIGSQDFAAQSLSRCQKSRETYGDELPSMRKAERIVWDVSHSLKLNGGEELRQRRKGALGRHLAMYLIRKETALPLRAIGDLLGVKAPAVARGIGKVEGLLKRQNLSNRIKGILQRRTADAAGVS